MSSETSTDSLQPWQLFTLAGLAGATAVVFLTREGGPAGAILLSITVGAAALVGIASWRALAPLTGVHAMPTTEILGGRTRAALEREKVLVLRSLKDLEFDRAMGKVAEKDFAEMSARLRTRAAGLLRQLDRGAGYRDDIEKELARRLGSAATKVVAYGKTDVGRNFSSGRACVCGTSNDPDAKFCKTCGTKLETA